MKAGVAKRVQPPPGKWDGKMGYECPVAGCTVQKRDTYEMGRHLRVHHNDRLNADEKKRYRARDCSPRWCDVCKKNRGYRRDKEHKCKLPKKAKEAAQGSAKKK